MADSQDRLAEVVGEALVRHRPWLATVLRARGVESGAIDEVLQEVGSAALASADRLRDSEKIAPWLYRIVVVSALQYRRRTGRRRKLAKRYAAGHGTAEQDGTTRAQPDPLDWLLAEELRQLVRQAIASLPVRDAELMLLKYTEDWTYRQLALHLGISESAVEARLHRARDKMRRAVSRLAPDLANR